MNQLCKITTGRLRKVQRCKQVCDSSMTTTAVMLFVFISCNKKPNKMN